MNFFCVGCRRSFPQLSGSVTEDCYIEVLPVVSGCSAVHYRLRHVHPAVGNFKDNEIFNHISCWFIIRLLQFGK